jgi:hypothetical protein
MNVRQIDSEKMKNEHFTHSAVVIREDDRVALIGKLLRAVILSHREHQMIGIVIKLESGEIIETFCDHIDFAEDFVMIKGGATIPVKAIVDVEL